MVAMSEAAVGGGLAMVFVRGGAAGPAVSEGLAPDLIRGEASGPAPALGDEEDILREARQGAGRAVAIKWHKRPGMGRAVARAQVCEGVVRRWVSKGKLFGAHGNEGYMVIAQVSKGAMVEAQNTEGTTI